MTSADRAACVVLDDRGSLLVVRRVKDGRRYCVLPGGGVEPGEDPATAAVRELREETGLDGRVGRRLATIDHPDRRAHYVAVHVDAAGHQAPALRPGSPEHARQTGDDRYEPAWVDLATLDAENLQPEEARALVLEAARDLVAEPARAHHARRLLVAGGNAAAAYAVPPARGVLRPLRPEDIDALVAVQEEGSVAALSHLFDQSTTPFPRAALRRRWEQELADEAVDCFVIGRDGDLDGFAAVTGDELLHLGTALRTWGSGLARLAHDELLDHLRERGSTIARLWVFEENHHARRFYEHRGWRPDGRRTRSAFAPNPVLLGYERDLRPTPVAGHP